MVEEVSFGDVEDAVDTLLPTVVVTSLVVAHTEEDTVDGEEVMLLTRGLVRGGHLLAIQRRNHLASVIFSIISHN